MDARNEDIAAARLVLEGFYGLGAGAVVERLPGGRVNLTFLVRGPDREYILQRLHPVFGGGGEVVENTAAVGEALAGTGVCAPRVISTKDGSCWAESGGIWRLTDRLPGRTLERRSRTAGAECARLLGEFHKSLNGRSLMLKELPRAEHSREGLVPVVEWESLIDEFRGDGKYGEAARALEAGRDLAENMPEATLTSQGIVHGDPKLENFLFEGEKAVGVIDLDTVRHGSYVWDLADGLRSWAGARSDDGAVHLDRVIAEAAKSAYRRFGPGLTDREWSSLEAATASVSLNLAFRYLADYFRETYFAWDESRYPSLAEQNLRRGRGLLELVRELLAVPG
jgi:Ser/Thr protein kinase RdoA (MazF antagonist)